MEQKYISTHQIALEFGVHPQTIRRACKRGAIRSIRVGRQLRIDLASVQEYILAGGDAKAA